MNELHDKLKLYKLKNRMKRIILILLSFALISGCKKNIDEPEYNEKKITLLAPQEGKVYVDSIFIKGRLINFVEKPDVEILVNGRTVKILYSADFNFSASYRIPRSGDMTSFAISARAVAGNSLYFSNSIKVKGISYDTPNNLSIEPGRETVIHIMWESHFDDFDSYIIERKTNESQFEQIGTAVKKEFYDENVDTGNIYYYRVRGLKDNILTPPSEAIGVTSVSDEIEDLPTGTPLPVSYIRRFINIKETGNLIFLDFNYLYVTDENGNLIKKIDYNPNNIELIDYCSSKNIFITYGHNKYLDIWDASTSIIVDSIYYVASITNLKLSITGDTLFTVNASDNSITVYDLISRTPIQVLQKKGVAPILNIKLLSGRVLAASERKDYINLFFLNHNFDNQWLYIGNRYIQDIAFSLDGDDLFSISTNKLFFIAIDYTNVGINKIINLNESLDINSAFYLPGNESIALIGHDLYIYSLIDNSIEKKRQLFSRYAQIDREQMKLIVPVSNYFTFYKIKRHWHQIQ